MNIELIEADCCNTMDVGFATVSGLESQGMDFGALDASWAAVNRDADPDPGVTVRPGVLSPREAIATFYAELVEHHNAKRAAVQAVAVGYAPMSKGAIAPTCAGLTTCSTDGERLGRLARLPGT